MLILNGKLIRCVSSYLFLGLFCAGCIASKESDRRLDLELLALNRNGEIVEASVGLRNLSSDTVYFVNMSCEYSAAFITDTKAAILLSEMCLKNSPHMQKIVPGGIFQYKLKVRVKRKKKFRLGFYWVNPPNEVADFDIIAYWETEIEKLKRSRQIVWSAFGEG